MRTGVQAVTLSADTAGFTEELRWIYAELGRTAGPENLAGECSPPVDVYETDDTVEIVVDIPGVSPSAVRIVAKGCAILIAGEKAPRRSRGDCSFHLVERGYGRFARAVRLTSACDSGRARATLAQGELRVSLPKVEDRRGRSMPITITGESTVA